MGKCPLCFRRLTIFNKPAFSFGKLKSGERLCCSCLRKVLQFLPQGTKLSSLEVNELSVCCPNLAQKQSQILGEKEVVKQISRVWQGDKSLEKVLTELDISFLAQVLDANESVQYLTNAFYKSSFGFQILTEKRLIFLCKTLFSGLSVKSLPLWEIKDIEYEEFLCSSKVIVKTFLRPYELASLKRKDALALIREFRALKERLEEELIKKRK